MRIGTVMRLWLVGTTAGALAALAAPVARATADDGCKCDDFVSLGATYQCNAAQTKCIAGSELCFIDCEA